MRFAPLSFIKPEELKQLHERIASLESQVNVATDFVKEIEKGNWEAQYELSKDGRNALQESLLSLRTQLQTYALQEKERNWVTEGLAKFIDILRSKNEDVSELTDSIIRNLVKYMGANQGALYLLNDDNARDPFIEMAACYAYDRKKHMHQRIEVGEGLAGQAVLEKDVIYMTDVPKTYVRITSGLGDASPSNLLIVPLKIEEKVFGVVEIASFSKIQKYQIEFVQRLGESIASTLAAVKTNQRTQKLLQETQFQAEQMRSQEEEMRQNMEELSATQEEMQRILKEVQDKEKYLNDLLSVSKDSIFTVGRDYKIMSYNQALVTALQGIGITEPKGFDMLSLYAADPKEKELQKSYYDRGFNGEIFETTSEYEYAGNKSYYSTSFAPLRDEAGKILAVASFSKETTAIVTAQKQAEKLLIESQQQSEQLRAQEEELRQNMEELSATQEEMHRILKEVQEKEKFLTDMLSVSKDSIFAVDKNYKVVSYNKALADGLAAMGIKNLKGFDMLSLYPDAAEKEKQKALYDRGFAGENYEATTDYTTDGITSYYTINYAPLRNAAGEIIAVVNFAKDTTAIVSAQKEAERLLQDQKQQSEELRAQEEELRQNMEELSATQEEMQRVLSDAQEKERYLSGLINSSEDSILTVDKNMKVVNCNEAFRKTYQSSGLEITKGFDINNLFSTEEDKKKYAAYYKRVFKGESFKVNEEYTFGDIKAYYNILYSPIRNEKGEIIASAVFVNDATQLTTAKKEVEKLLEVSSEAVKDMQDKERYLNELINVTNDAIFTLDKNFKIVSFNNALAKGMEASGVVLEKGHDILAGLPEHERQRELANYKKAFKGESFEMINEITVGPEQKLFFSINYAPLHDNNGKISSVAVFSKDVTALYNKK